MRMRVESRCELSDVQIQDNIVASLFRYAGWGALGFDVLWTAAHVGCWCPFWCFERCALGEGIGEGWCFKRGELWPRVVVATAVVLRFALVH